MSAYSDFCIPIVYSIRNLLELHLERDVSGREEEASVAVSRYRIVLRTFLFWKLWRCCYRTSPSEHRYIFSYYFSYFHCVHL